VVVPAAPGAAFEVVQAQAVLSSRWSCSIRRRIFAHRTRSAIGVAAGGRSSSSWSARRLLPVLPAVRPGERGAAVRLGLFAGRAAGRTWDSALKIGMVDASLGPAVVVANAVIK
jgi:hypothetical protein